MKSPNSYIAFLLVFSFRLTNGNISSGGPPIGLFLELSSWWYSGTPQTIVDELTYICQNHRVANGNNQLINDLVLLTVGTANENANHFAVPPDPSTNDVLLWNWVEPLLKFFPGGNGPCNFNRVYVGTLVMGTPPGFWHAYIDGISNSSFRENMRLRQLDIAKRFMANVAQSANPSVTWDWYISQEIGLEYVWYDGVADGYTEYISKQMIDLNALRPNRQFMWSPFFDYNPALWPTNAVNGSTVLQRLKTMFTNIASRASSAISACSSPDTCPFSLALQDHVGGFLLSSRNVTKEDAVTWFNRLKTVFPFKTLTMNVELFLHNWWNDAAGYYSADCQEALVREQFYQSKGIPFGPAFELRHWYKCHHPGNVRKVLWTWPTWSGADAYCKSAGANLTSIHSKAENDFVVGLSNAGETSIWVGLYNPFLYNGAYEGIKNGTIIFQWSDGLGLDYWNWSPGYPVSIDSNKCGIVYPKNSGGQWANGGCGWKADAFVCKK
ncbi:lectin c-type domain-containing protein [Ditylenchus destructor]|nr:lectin c-type domain-containing protein [Ditylenchus destructor]